MTSTGLLILVLGLLLITLASIPLAGRRIRDLKGGHLQLRQSDNYKWWVFGTVGTGTFMSVLGHGSILIALPSIARHFDASLTTVLWIAISETLAVSSLLLSLTGSTRRTG